MFKQLWLVAGLWPANGSAFNWHCKNTTVSRDKQSSHHHHCANHHCTGHETWLCVLKHQKWNRKFVLGRETTTLSWYQWKIIRKVQTELQYLQLTLLRQTPHPHDLVFCHPYWTLTPEEALLCGSKNKAATYLELPEFHSSRWSPELR